MQTSPVNCEGEYTCHVCTLQDAQTTCKKSRGEWKDVEFDSEGHVVAMQKINPARLPKDM